MEKTENDIEKPEKEEKCVKLSLALQQYLHFIGRRLKHSYGCD